MGDFYRQKICWNRIAKEKLFALVDEGIFIQDSMHFIVGNNLEYICSMLNSKLFIWLMNLIVGEAAGGNAGNADNVKKLNIPILNFKYKKTIEKLFNQQKYDDIDKLIYKLYKLTEEEIAFIERT